MQTDQEAWRKWWELETPETATLPSRFVVVSRRATSARSSGTTKADKVADEFASASEGEEEAAPASAVAVTEGAEDGFVAAEVRAPQ